MKYKKIFLAASLLFATAAFSTTSQAVDFNLCTGGPGGNYEYTGKLLAKQVKGADINVNVVNTAGSMDNLKRLDSGECDGAIAQSDAVYVYKQDEGDVSGYSLGDLYTEYVHLLCRRDSKITDVGDLTDKTKVMVGKIGSGHNVSFRGMILADKEYGGNEYTKIPLVNEGGDASSLVKLKAGVASCMIYTGAPGTEFMSKQANKFGEDLVLVPIIDKDFNDVVTTDRNGIKTSVWRQVEMPYKSYKNIMPSGLFGRKDIDTFGVNAQFIASNKWADENPEAFGELGLYLPDVQNQLRADRGLILKN